MKVNLSSYLAQTKDVLKTLITELDKDFSYVSVLGVDTKGKTHQVTHTGASLNDSSWNERGFVIRVHNTINYFEYSFNMIPDDLAAFVSTIKEEINKGLQLLSERKHNSYDVLQDTSVTDSFFGEVKVDLNDLSSEEKMNTLEAIVKSNMSSSDKLIDIRASFEHVTVSKVFLSKDKDLEQAYTWSQGTCVAIVRDDNDTKFYYDATAGLGGLEYLDKVKSLAPEVIEGAISLLEAELIKPGMYDIICAPDVSGLVAHEAFGHGVEMDMFVKNRAKSMEYLNKPVASKHVNMHDGAKAATCVSSYLFDDEGTLGTDTQIIKSGILENGISDVLSALKLNTTPTGNGKRESFERKAYARMTNTIFKSGTDKLEDMIKAIKSGYLLEAALGGMEDPKNWGIQCEALIGREIIDGKLTGKIVSPVLLTGYVPDLLSNIDMVSEDFKLFGSGACGKGHKEWVKTADGGPYLKTKGRLG
jgi:TldD protein